MTHKLERTYQELLCYLTKREAPFGQWITGLWPPLPVLNANYGVEEHIDALFFVLERLLREGRAVFDVPNDVPDGEPECTMRRQANWDFVWDIPIEEQIAYMKAHFPKDADDVNDLKINDFFYGNHCPRIGWVDPQTGGIIAS